MKIKKIYASEIAKLTSNVYTGGGDDDTEAIQRFLDMAKDEDTGVYLIMDGAALVREIKLYSNTTIECMNSDCGFYQVGGMNRSLVKNAVWDMKHIKTKNITLIGGTYHQNGQNQEHDDPNVIGICNHDECDNVETIETENGTVRRYYSAADLNNTTKQSGLHFVMGLEFFGVENLLVRDITIRDFRTFAFMVGCFKNVTVQNVWLDLPYGTKGNQDGFHFWGPGQFLKVLNCGGKVGDDVINVGPDEREKEASITDVLIDGIMMDDGEQAVRLLSRGTGRLDRVTVRNITGVYRSYGFYIDPWFVDTSLGNFGNIFIENVDLKAAKNTYDYHPPVLFSIGGNIETLTLKNIRHHNSVDSRPLIEIGLPFYETHPSNFAEYKMPAEQKIQNIIIDGLEITEWDGEPEDTNYITVHDKIDNMVLKNVIVIKNQKENGELLHFYPKGEIKNFVSENIHTKGLKTLISDESKIKNRF